MLLACLHEQTYVLSLLLGLKSELKSKLADILCPSPPATVGLRRSWSGSQARLNEKSFVFRPSWRVVGVVYADDNIYKEKSRSIDLPFFQLLLSLLL